MDVNEPRRLSLGLLDGLPASDPRAQRSRADLRRIHRAMGTLSIMRRALERGTAHMHPRQLLERNGPRNLDSAVSEILM